MPTSKKLGIVKEIEETLDKYKSFIITDYSGLNVAHLTDLRKKLREEGVIYQIVKNNLIKIAVENKKIEGLEKYFHGPTAVAFAKDDPLSASKILTNFSKKNKLLKLKGAYSEGTIFGKEGVIELSTLPSKEVLISILMGSLKSPLTKLSIVFSSLQRKLVYTLDQISKKKE